MADRAARGADALALQVGRAFQRRIGLHEHRRAVRVGAVRADHLDACARREREDHRRVADRAAVDGGRVQRFCERRGGRELGPRDVVRQAVQFAGRFEQRAQPAFLVAGTQQRPRARLSAQGGRGCGDRGEGARLCEEMASSWIHREARSEEVQGFNQCGSPACTSRTGSVSTRSSSAVNGSPVAAGTAGRAVASERHNRSASDQPALPGNARARSQPRRSARLRAAERVGRHAGNRRECAPRVGRRCDAIGSRGAGCLRHGRAACRDEQGLPARVFRRRRRARRERDDAHALAVAPALERLGRGGAAAHVERRQRDRHGPRAFRLRAAARGKRFQVVEHGPGVLGPSVVAKPGIVDPPCSSRVPWRTRQNSSPSRRRASSAPAKVGGQRGSVAASGPSPRPSAPWHAAQCCAYRCAPRITFDTENGAGSRWKLVGTAGESQRRRRPRREPRNGQRGDCRYDTPLARRQCDASEYDRQRRCRHGERELPRESRVDAQRFERDAMGPRPRGLTVGVARQPDRMQHARQRDLRAIQPLQKQERPVGERRCVHRLRPRRAATLRRTAPCIYQLASSPRCRNAS